MKDEFPRASMGVGDGLGGSIKVFTYEFLLQNYIQYFYLHVGILRYSLLAQGHKISPWQSGLELQFGLCDSKSSASPTTLW